MGQDVYVNTLAIQIIQNASLGTEIHFGINDYITVKESPEQIISIIEQTKEVEGE